MNECRLFSLFSLQDTKAKQDSQTKQDRMAKQDSYPPRLVHLPHPVRLV